MFFHLFSRKKKSPEEPKATFRDCKRSPLQKAAPIQQEYVELIRSILNSPLWDGTDDEIYRSLPADLTEETLLYAKKADHSD
ncbi:hypothetical protein H6A65_01480 [Mediterraneibacter glycyrrhizinilyticus]|uniref:hypothetical protein n=1 Tax=Mediterraneibacter glycyrrhizinilyticus TaxID=342942 RepID=UPI001961DBB8|nr:hypothetical protein [Mediterraneibacter glycyrrhizinilyticus]MBM6750176.1 hypothetical protein [Mediterraneibacter glycyrrhizinilyticus]